jgi:hypothetical protein
MTRVHEVTRDDLLRRRADILHGLGVTYEDLAKRAGEYALVADEWSAWDEIREINFLLGDDR